jgi:hypothetical protein
MVAIKLLRGLKEEIFKALNGAWLLGSLCGIKTN